MRKLEKCTSVHKIEPKEMGTHRLIKDWNLNYASDAEIKLLGREGLIWGYSINLRKTNGWTRGGGATL